MISTLPAKGDALTGAERRERIKTLQAMLKRGEQMMQHHVDGLQITSAYIRSLEQELIALQIAPRRLTPKQHARQAIKQARDAVTTARQAKHAAIAAGVVARKPKRGQS